MLAVFLSSILGTISIAPTIAENPVISEVERVKDVCWFHLMTGQYTHGVTVENIHYSEKGYLALTYRNLSPATQFIRLNTTPGANHAFYHWPEKTASEVELQRDTESAWLIWEVVPDEIYLMADLWFIGWDFYSEVTVSLELWHATGYETLYQGTLAMMPLGP